MLLDLSEALACPACGPPQGVIVLVERMEDRRVIDGRLDCPMCEARFPLRDGVVDFGVAPDPDRSVPAVDPEDAVTAAALLGIRHGRGLLVIDSGLGAAAARIGSLCGGCEVVRLEPRGLPADYSPALEGESVPGQAAVTPLLGGPTGMIPLLSGKAIGVALEGGEKVLLAEAARVLIPGGRVAVIRPVPEAASVLEHPPFELLAADPRAIVARKI
jgi:uncharacterized protein YbaR (Trm112 family)